MPIFPEFLRQIDPEYFWAIVSQYLSVFWFYFPLGIIGIWRWSSWLFKKSIAKVYISKNYSVSKPVSIVTPVYNEDPAVFSKALNSWRANKPIEIIAVIDHSDARCVAEFKKFKKDYPKAKLIVTKTPGKRAALVEGIKASKGEILALVDSDTIWSHDVLKNSLAPFFDPKVGGVGTRQAVLSLNTISQIIFDIQLYIRYHEEMPFLSASGSAVSCLSGRTAFYRKEAIFPHLTELLNETFWGEKVISGEDKRLTYLIQAAGWKTFFQSSALVYTPGTKSLVTFFKQRLRWSRNGWRADLRALFQGWVFRHPALAYHLVDRIVQPFVMLTGFLYLIVSLISGLYAPAVLIFIWWHLGRLIKIYPYLTSRSIKIVFLPIYVASTYAFALTKIYALMTLNTQGWITRWDISRLPRVNLVRFLFGQAGVSFIVSILLLGILTFRQSSLVPAAIASGYQRSRGLVEKEGGRAGNLTPSVLGSNDASISTFRIYKVGKGESIGQIAEKFNVRPQSLIDVNSVFLPNWRILRAGNFLVIPDKDARTKPGAKYNNSKKYYPALEIKYDKGTDTIMVNGRGNMVYLSDIRKVVGEEYIGESSPGEWLLASNLVIGSGVTLKLESSNVAWLKLASSKDEFINVLVDGGGLVLDGVKVTSWDNEEKSVDRKTSDGRSYITAKFGSLVNIYNSELAYLGYENKGANDNLTTYGISLVNPQDKVEGDPLTGEVVKSQFHHNYYGLFLSGVTGINVQENKFFENLGDGFGSRNFSSRLVIRDNKIYKNGLNGLVLGKGNTANLISNNEVRDNSLSNLLLDRADRNVAEGNLLKGAGESGLALDNSTENRIISNVVIENKTGLVASLSSSGNIFEKNQFVGNYQFGVRIKEGGDNNHVTENRFSKNSIAIYVRGKGNVVENNHLINNKTGIYLAEDASLNTLESNNFSGNQLYHIYLKTNRGQVNYLVSRVDEAR